MAVIKGRPIVADRLSTPAAKPAPAKVPGALTAMLGGTPKATPATLAQILKATGATAGEAQRFANIAKAATQKPAPKPAPSRTPVPPVVPPVVPPPAPPQPETTTTTGQSTGGGAVEDTPRLPKETGNVVVDQANILANILNSPLYTESIKNAYLTQYLPGLTQANYEINKARSQEVQNDFLRRQAQASAIREIAGSYAARGLRTPKMVTESFAPVQQATELERTAAEQVINDLIAGKEVLYGAGAKDAETFITDPIMFGSIGAGARRSALAELLALPDIYGLTQVAKASSAPLIEDTPVSIANSMTATQGGGFERPAPVTGDEEMARPAPYTGDEGMAVAPTSPKLSAAQLQTKIAAANKYISQQKAKNNAKTVAGATKKLQDYQNQLAGLGGM